MNRLTKQLGCLDLEYSGPTCHGRQNKSSMNNSVGIFRQNFSDAKYQRPWKKVGTTNGKDLEFTISSYNVLSQDLLESHLELYEECEDKYLDWNHRKQVLLKELTSHNPDILCLQEVNCEHFQDFFQPELQKKGYYGIYKQRTGEKLDGCATFVKQDKFLIEKVVEVEYNCERMQYRMNRDNVGLLVLVRSQKFPNRRLCIANTHLLYNPNRGDIKLAQIMMLMAEIDRMRRMPAEDGSVCNHPVILCGDLNLVPQSHLYLFLCHGILQIDDDMLQSQMSGIYEPHSGSEYKMQDSLFRPKGIQNDCRFGRDTYLESPLLHHPLGLTSAYNHYIKVRPGSRDEREVSTYHGNDDSSAMLDYILYSVDEKRCSFKNGRLQTRIIEEGKLQLLGVLELIPESEIASVGSLPNRYLPSDHLIIMAKFVLKN